MRYNESPHRLDGRSAMPRTPRKRSASGYHHVVPKGIAGQTIFGDDHDRKLYLKWLAEATTESGIILHAYCLMSNHVHLAIEDPSEKLSEAMKYVHERYGMYYSEKIDRHDGIFRKPFWSEPIEDDGRLLCTVRYIHANPAAAGICRASAWPWSSVGDYLGKDDPANGGPAVPGLAETGVALDLLGGRKGFIEWSMPAKSTALPFTDSKLKKHLTDDEAIRVAADILGHDSRKGCTIDEAELLLARGFSIAQIERISGISRYRLRKQAS